MITCVLANSPWSVLVCCSHNQFIDTGTPIVLLPSCFCHSHNHCSCRYSRVDVISILELQSLTVGNAVPIIHKEIMGYNGTYKCANKFNMVNYLVV